MFVIFVIFSYHNNYLDNIFIPLENIVVDLYNMLTYVKSIGCKYKDILLLTDIVNDSNEAYLLQLVLKGYVRSEIHTMIKNLKEHNSYIHISNMSNLRSIIKSECDKYNRILFYYSGHGSYDRFVIPNNININNNINNIEYYYINDVLKDIIQPSESSIQGVLKSDILSSEHENKKEKEKDIFMILDACQLSGGNLPFKMNNTGTHHLNHHHNVFINKIKEDHMFTRHNIVCITSSHIYDNILISQNGSLLTYHLTAYLSELHLNIAHYSKNMKNRITYDLKTLLIKMRSECKSKFIQSINIYASKPDIYYIWLWLLGIENKLHINYDIGKNTCIVEKILS
jgi:hypothetical protein